MPKPPLRSFAELAGFGEMLASQQKAPMPVAFTATPIVVRGTLEKPRLTASTPLEDLIAAVAEIKGVQHSAVMAINSLLNRMNTAVHTATSLDGARLAVEAESSAFRLNANPLAAAINNEDKDGIPDRRRPHRPRSAKAARRAKRRLSDAEGGD